MLATALRTQRVPRQPQYVTCASAATTPYLPSLSIGKSGAVVFTATRQNKSTVMGLDTKACRDGFPSDITHVTSQTASQSDSHAAGRNGRAAMRALSLPNARTPKTWRNTQHHPCTDEANYHHVRPYAPSATQRRLDKQPLAFQSCQTPPMHHAAASSASSSVATGATSSTPCWSHARPPGPHTVPD